LGLLVQQSRQVQSNQAKSADGQKLAPGRAVAESAWFAQDGEHGGTSGTWSQDRAGAESLIALLDGGQNARDTGHDLRV
jgi:hypothetical protein